MPPFSTAGGATFSTHLSLPTTFNNNNNNNGEVLHVVYIQQQVIWLIPMGRNTTCCLQTAERHVTYSNGDERRVVYIQQQLIWLIAMRRYDICCLHTAARHLTDSNWKVLHVAPPNHLTSSAAFSPNWLILHIFTNSFSRGIQWFFLFYITILYLVIYF